MLVCVTGQLGTGKTTALNILKTRGFNTLAMDDYIHAIYQKDNLGYKLIIQNFGNEYVNGKEVNRKKLGKLVFSNKKNLKKLNDIMIPLIQNKLVELKKEYQLLFVEMAIYLNHEKLFRKYFNKVILIKAKKNIKKINLNKKMAYIRRFPTNDVGNTRNPIRNSKIKCDFIVGNNENLKKFQEKILKISKKF